MKKETTAKKTAAPLLRKTVELDAEGKVMGRLACEIVLHLRGKNKATFEFNQDRGDVVKVINAAKMKLTGKKLEQKEYYHYSGYPGGLKRKKASSIALVNPGEMLKRAVWNMLPKNKLRSLMIKRLKISN